MKPIRFAARIATALAAAGCALAVVGVLLPAAWAQDTGAPRVRPPEFESGHELPLTTSPPPSAPLAETLDAAVLLTALAVAAWLVLRVRSRRAVAWLAAACLAYFGFWREGCVCPVGATQNVALALFDPGYAVPLVVAAFFFLPLVFTLAFGRVFCAGVCPLGAIQDVFLLRPVRVPAWLDEGLRLLAYAYLGLAVLYAATDSAFVICRYEPFVSFFRLSGGAKMLALGACILVLGMFVGRPYCRWLCPYGVLLGFAGFVSRWRVSITPDRCVQCRLCEDSCPYGAIVLPTPARTAENRVAARRRLAGVLAALPLLVLAAGWLGGRLGPTLARAHPTLALAERLRAEDRGEVRGTVDPTVAFRRTGKPAAALYAEAAAVRERFDRGGVWLGVWLGLAVGLRLVFLCRLPRRAGHEADRSRCLACARCFDYCPTEYERRKAAFAV